MENGQRTISSLFDGRKIFHIPKYQRAYAWEGKQLSDFVDDFENQDVNKDYFFGTILFQQREKVDNFEHIDIVDGQQRITTLIIFMKMLLEKLKAQGDDIEILEETYIQYKDEYKLKVLPHDDDFFQSCILQDNKVAKTVIRTTSQKKLLDAKSYLGKRIEKYEPDVLRELKDKVERTKVLTYSVVDNAEATLIFETTNDRGKPLTNLEKTKSFLMYKTYLASDNPETHLDAIQNRFSDIYRDYEAIEDKIGEDAVLQYHFSAFEKWSVSRSNKEYQQPVQMLKKKVNNLIKDQMYSEAMDYIEKYSRELRETFAIFKSLLLNPSDNLQDVFALARPANFYPLLIKSYKYDQSPNKAKFDKVARLIETISFRVYSMWGRRSDTGRDWLYRLARDFKGDFKSLLKELKNVIGEYCDDDDFRYVLLLPNFYEVIAPNDRNYLFWKYENYLRCTEQPVISEMTYQDFSTRNKRTRLSIEHIIPQNPKKSIVVTDTDILPRMTRKFKENYLHCIGNLTIDPLSANISKSNHNFAIKNQKYFEKALLKTQNELIEFLNQKTKKWDVESIEERRAKILRFALEYWDYRKM